MTVQKFPHQRYYRYDPDSNSFAGIGFSMDDDDAITDIHWTDAPLLATWKPRRCHVFDDDPPVDGDFPSLCNFCRIPLMSERAWIALRPLIGFCCEALPIIHPSGRPYFIVHVMNTIDCLDAEASEVSRSEVRKNRINRIYRYALKDRMLYGQHLFKLPYLSGGELIVNDEFRKCVEKNGLRGLCFEGLPMNSFQ